jgi:zinc finger FYVE domain-containing protein 26
MHFDEGLSARHKGGESTKLVTKGLRGKSASEKLTEEGLVKFSTRVSIQVIGCTQSHFWNSKFVFALWTV